jgi:uncharacterized protein (DUF305 family)
MCHRLTLTALVSVVALAAPAGALAAPTAAAATANATDKAFVREMVPHHQMAVEMARMAELDATHKAVRSLASQIIKAQNAEMSTLKGIAKRVGVKVESMPGNGTMTDQTMRDLDTLGVSMDDSGMMMDMTALHGAKPFDRKFIDLMIPHHQGAIRMARAELAKGNDRALRTIGRGIVAAQAREIRQMNAWRKAWYGRSSPAGGVPSP